MTGVDPVSLAAHRVDEYGVAKTGRGIRQCATDGDHAMPGVLGIDSGLTVTKAVVFDASGAALSVARRRVPQWQPIARHVERDADALWTATAEAIREAVEGSRLLADEIVGVGVTAHGDGLFLLDATRRPLGPGILSLDSRAGEVIEAWQHDGTVDRALRLTGQHPHVSAPSALLAWMRHHDPARFERIASVLACKDWLRFCLSGTVGTDRTEASTSFAEVESQAFSGAALALYGLDALADALPPISGSTEVVGQVTDAAARQTGLAVGTPVVAGLHDVTASALGIGAHRPGVLAMVAGTYSINEVVADAPRRDGRWFCRSAIERGRWNHMAISPASAANYDWFLDTFCAHEREAVEATGASIHARLADEIDDARSRPTSMLFHPYLYGSPHGPHASASFVGLQGWHTRGDLLFAVLEGIAFNHRDHVEALRDGFTFGEARLTGGVSRSPAVAQLFADALDLPVTTVEVDEAAAWGAAICAATGVGLYGSIDEAPTDRAFATRRFEPDASRAAREGARYATYRKVSERLGESWPALQMLAATDGPDS